MTLYVFDSGSIRVLRNYYPRRFPSFWRNLEDAIKADSVISVREVFNELEDLLSGHPLWDWVEGNKRLFVTPSAEETAFVAQIFTVSHFRMLVGETQRLRGKPVADPFVIAVARTRQGKVVTEETLRPNAAKIPNVCQHFQVPYLNMEGFLTENGWEF